MCILTIKFFDDDKKSYLYGRFFVSNFTTEHIENVQISRIFTNFRFFKVLYAKIVKF